MTDRRSRASMPSDIDPRVGFFDRFAGSAASFASRAPFFAACVLVVALWLVEGAVRIATDGFGAFLDESYQLQINSTTTIVTFLMVALLQNSATRGDLATQHKLNAMADALADLMEQVSERFDDETLRRDVAELRAAVGLEERETTGGR